MSYNTYNTLVGKPEITTLVLKTITPKTKRTLFCLHCGGFLQYIYKKVVMVVQGASDPAEVIQEIRCPKCKAIFEIS